MSVGISASTVLPRDISKPETAMSTQTNTLGDPQKRENRQLQKKIYTRVIQKKSFSRPVKRSKT